MKLVLLWLVLFNLLDLSLKHFQSSDKTALTDLKPINQYSSSSENLDQVCQQLKQKIKNIDATRTTLALEAINRELKICLPLMKRQQQMEFLILSTQMYNDFLKVQRTPEQEQALQQYATEFNSPSMQPSAAFEQLSTRDQYLVQHQPQAYIDLFYDGEKFVYRQHPEYIAKIFSPYWPADQQIFIQAVAKHNTTLTADLHKLYISSEEVLKRAVFWHHYVQTYPNSKYLKHAKKLAKLYEYLFFFGIGSDQVVQVINQQVKVKAENLALIKQLALENQGHLNQQAQRFLGFVELSMVERKLMCISHPNLSIQEQLALYLDLTKPSQQQLKTCFSKPWCE